MPGVIHRVAGTPVQKTGDWRPVCMSEPGSPDKREIDPLSVQEKARF
jgi:hypothetical protein